jgi:uncharacterized membrane protein
MKKKHVILRFFSHLLSGPWQIKTHFPDQSLHRIEQAIEACERMHAGEIRFVVEAGLHPIELLHSISPKARAINLFSLLRIWDTEFNNGVLIYLLLADRDVEIVADRGIHQYVGDNGWEKICHGMEVLFRKGEFELGVLQGITEISQHLATHFPLNGESRNEISNRPLVV